MTPDLFVFNVVRFMQDYVGRVARAAARMHVLGRAMNYLTFNQSPLCIHMRRFIVSFSLWQKRSSQVRQSLYYSKFMATK